MSTSESLEIRCVRNTVRSPSDDTMVSLVEKVATEAGARTLAVDHKTGRVYLPVGQFGPTPAGQRGRGPTVPGSFHVLVFGE